GSASDDLAPDNPEPKAKTTDHNPIEFHSLACLNLVRRAAGDRKPTRGERELAKRERTNRLQYSNFMNRNTLRPFAQAILGASLGALLVAGCSTKAPNPERRDLAAIKHGQAAATPAEVLDWLKSGNQRFVAGKTHLRDMLHDVRVTSAGQYPRAVLLS